MRFEVDTTQVGQAVHSMDDLIKQISDQRKKMMTAIDEMNGMWIGSAHDAFLAQFQKDNQSMIELISLLKQMSGKYSEARTAYDTCEASAVNTIAAIQV